MDSPGYSPHLKIRNLTAHAKSLLPFQLQFSQVLGLGYEQLSVVGESFSLPYTGAKTPA